MQFPEYISLVPMRFIAKLFLLFAISIGTADAASCRIPLKYKIGSIDERFKIKDHEITVAVTDAARLWEEAVGRSLFVNAANADLTINFVFDDRQHRVQQKYDTMRNKLLQKERQLEAIKEEHERIRARYEKDKRTYERACEI